jgi:ribosome-associated protein
MDLRRLSSVSDFFVIATATSRPQLAAIAEHIEAVLRRVGQRVSHIEGLAPSKSAKSSALPARHAMGQAGNGFSWVLMDCGSLVVHLFDPPARQFYQLERLWGDAPRLSLGARIPLASA